MSLETGVETQTKSVLPFGRRRFLLLCPASLSIGSAGPLVVRVVYAWDDGLVCGGCEFVVASTEPSLRRRPSDNSAFGQFEPYLLPPQPAGPELFSLAAPESPRPCSLGRACVGLGRPFTNAVAFYSSPPVCCFPSAARGFNVPH